MNDTLKVAGRIGAELGAAKTENEKLRKALKRIIDRCEAFVDDEAEMRTPSVEVLMGIAEDAIYTVHEADVALSQQPEPTDTYTAVDMATAAAQAFRDGQAAVEQATAQDEQEVAAVIGFYVGEREPRLLSWNVLPNGEHRLYTRPAQTAPQGKFRMGDLVKKSTGSEWVGRVVGCYSTEQTPEGYAVESSAHRNSVQIYPAKALEAVDD